MVLQLLLLADDLRKRQKSPVFVDKTPHADSKVATEGLEGRPCSLSDLQRRTVAYRRLDRFLPTVT